MRMEEVKKEQKYSFHRRQFKAYLALRGLTKVDVAKKIGMTYMVFKTKSNQCLIAGSVPSYKVERYFTYEECIDIINALRISEKWQRRIFSRVLVPKKTKQKSVNVGTKIEKVG